MWALKNIGDTFLTKDIGTRQIILGVFQRQKNEQNVNGKFAVIHFLGDGRMEHPLYCFSKQPDNRYLGTRQIILGVFQRQKNEQNVNGKFAYPMLQYNVFIAVNAPHRIAPGHGATLAWSVRGLKIGTTPDVEDAMIVTLEQPLREPRHDLVVCMAPMYIYTDWETLLVGIETWLALGATKIIVPVQSASLSSYKILQEYEKRGIEESHVNCLFFAKPWANMIVFSDIDDLLLPVDPMQIKAGINVEILKNLFAEHPQAGSLLFEHRDVQFQLPVLQDSPTTLANFNFNFLTESKFKMNCNVWRMKTRVVVNASRVDSVNMHETGIHRFGYVQTRVPCRQFAIQLSLQMSKHVDCVAARAEYDFFRSGSGYFLQTTNVSITASDPNCEAPVPQIVAGNHYFAP
ncbi:hypothetical protein OSTOST_10520 [Ostertagia ostertagi]